jgi:hypothetical protein
MVTLLGKIQLIGAVWWLRLYIAVLLGCVIFLCKVDGPRCAVAYSNARVLACYVLGSSFKAPISLLLRILSASKNSHCF